MHLLFEIDLHLRRLNRIFRESNQIAFTIQLTFGRLTWNRAAILRTPLCSRPLAMRLNATKRTAQIIASRVGPICKKENATMLAVL